MEAVSLLQRVIVQSSIDHIFKTSLSEAFPDGEILALGIYFSDFSIL